MELVYGTNNPAKLSSMKWKLEGLELDLTGLKSIDVELNEPDESGKNPADNARIKALSYYKQLGRPVMSADSGLYFEGVSDEDQPGVHIKRIQGLDLDYDDLIGFYSALAKKYGGKLLAHYKNALCLVIDEDNVFVLEGEQAESEPFYIVDTPHKNYADGFPLDSLSVDVKTMKYYYDIEEVKDKYQRTAFDDNVRDFVRRHLAKLEVVES